MFLVAVEAGDGAAEAERGALARHRAERDGEEQQERPDEGEPRRSQHRERTTSYLHGQRKAGASTVETACCSVLAYQMCYVYAASIRTQRCRGYL